MIKRYKGGIICFYVFAIISLVVATFFDLQIDHALNNPTDPFSVWFYNTGEMPARIVCPLAGVVLFYLGEKLITRLFGLVACIGGSAYLGTHISNYFFKDENNILFGVVYGLGVAAIILFFGQYIKIPGALKKPLIVFAYAGIVTMFVQIGIVEGSKYVWARPRYRAMLAENNFDRFTPWYHPNGFNFDEGNEVKSFPSGHTASAAMSYLTMLLPFCFEKMKSKAALCFIVPFVYTSIVAYTRMVMGAHFLSDVTCGAIITFTVIVVAMAIIDKKAKTPLA